MSEHSAPPSEEWLKLSSRMIWVDLIQSILALSPGLIAIYFVGIDPQSGGIWPFVAIAVIGLWGAVSDAWRWLFTSYRITPSHLEIKTGFFFRTHRQVQRDRIRSVDIEARLRHRLSGLRLVTVGAGQQSTAGESALNLDAVTRDDAQAIRERLLNQSRTQMLVGEELKASAPVEQVYARLKPSWVIYNLYNFWAYILIAGLGWGAYWLLSSFGVDVLGFFNALIDWNGLGIWWSSLLIFLVATILGAIGLGVVFFMESWNFELALTQSDEGMQLRTRQGLLTTREVNRDVGRIRGVSISEPLIWRWMGMADTNLITTGLNLWSMNQPTTIVPRGPVSVAKRVAALAIGVNPDLQSTLGGQDPLHTALSTHPPAALRRRLWWATVLTALLTACALWFQFTAGTPYWITVLAIATWPLFLILAMVAYRALGHSLVGPWVVTRSGLLNRATNVLQGTAVSTLVVRESFLQRRLGLRSLGLMTAAGTGSYAITDINAKTSIEFAHAAVPGILNEFLSESVADRS